MAASTITVSYYDAEGDEVSAELPAKHEVCERCEGHGTHLTPSIGNHAYSAEEFYESFDDEEDRAAYFQRGGKYDITCLDCKGKNVVLVVDEAACTTAEQKEILAAYNDAEESNARYESECRAERRMEAGMLGDYDTFYDGE